MPPAGRSTSRRRGSATSSRRLAGRSRARRWSSSSPESLDVVGLAEDDLEAAFQVFTVRGGRVLGSQGLDRRSRRGPRPARSSSRRSSGSSTWSVRRCRRGSSVPTEPADREVLETWLSDRRGSHVTIAVPARGAKRRLMEVVASNATEAFHRHKLRRASDFGARSRALSELAEQLGLEQAPASDRVLRHLQPRAHRHGGIDGGLRGRPAEALRLPPVRDQGRPRTGRFREHGGDAHPPVLAAAEGEGRGARRASGGDSPIRRRSSSWTAAAGS